MIVSSIDGWMGELFAAGIVALVFALIFMAAEAWHRLAGPPTPARITRVRALPRAPGGQALGVQAATPTIDDFGVDRRAGPRDLIR